MKRKQARRDRMRSLFDRQSPLLLLFLVFTKMLQAAKRIGIRAREDGWRRVVSTFFHTEHSKFSLAAFRLKLWYESGRGGQDFDHKIKQRQ